LAGVSPSQSIQRERGFLGAPPLPTYFREHLFRDCLKIPDKLKSPLAIFQTVSLGGWVNKGKWEAECKACASTGMRMATITAIPPHTQALSRAMA
jgi:hypothetical protein